MSMNISGPPWVVDIPPVSGGGIVSTTAYASAAALEAAYPAASNSGKQGLVGTAAPYAIYVSNGTVWSSTAETGGVPASSNVGTRVFTTGIMAANGPSSIFLSGTFLNDGTDVGTEAGAVELGEFTEVRLLYCNNSPFPLTITGAAALAIADFTDKAQDTAFATAPQFTFNGGASSMTIPPGASSPPRIYGTDWLTLSSVDRTDVVGATPVLGWRTRFALPNGSAHAVSSWDAAGSDWGSGRFQLWVAGMYGDKLTTTLSRPLAINNRRLICGIQYRSPYKVMTVMCVGTSLSNNNTSVLSRVPGGWISALHQQLSTNKRPIEFLNWGQSGQTSSQFRTNFEVNAKVLSFTHAYAELFDTNGAGSTFPASAQNTNWQNVTAILQQASQIYGAKVGGWAGLPRCTGNAQTCYYTTQGDLNRLAYNAKWALSLGRDYTDVSPAMVAPNTAPQLVFATSNGQSEDRFYDLLHPNQAGINAVTPLHAALIQRWADAYFTN